MGHPRGNIAPGSGRERTVVGLALSLAGLLLLLDQLTKSLVVGSFALHESRPVIDGFFALTYVTNKGAAWSMLEGQTWLLLSVAVIVTVAAFWFLRNLTEGFTERYFAVFVVLSGVFGNSIDRIWRGEVVDFFDCYIRWSDRVYHWPVFNVADIAICVGVGVFILSNFIRHFRTSNEDTAGQA